MLTNKLMQLTVAGGSEWVLILLLALSVISVAIMVERGLYYHRRIANLDRLDGALQPLIIAQDTAAMSTLLEKEDEPILKAAVASCSAKSTDREGCDKIVASATAREHLRLEKRLTYLGTLGNNAPFIGLFGTVLGIIRAFRDLSLDTQGNSSVVMAGISEALVATAVGLFVALPAVLFFNYFQRKVERLLSINESLAQGILSGVPGIGTGKKAWKGKEA
jgi:biopolymer transport protein ExbB